MSSILTFIYMHTVYVITPDAISFSLPLLMSVLCPTSPSSIFMSSSFFLPFLWVNELHWGYLHMHKWGLIRQSRHHSVSVPLWENLSSSHISHSLDVNPQEVSSSMRTSVLHGRALPCQAFYRPSMATLSLRLPELHCVWETPFHSIPAPSLAPSFHSDLLSTIFPRLLRGW